jgi:hypothetical protein
MRGFLRRSESRPARRGRVLGAPASAIGCLCVAALGCSPQVLVAVDPDSCASGDGSGCVTPDLLDDLVGYWRFDDGPGSASARDSSGHGNNGALVGLNSNNVWVSGRSGTAMEFGGAGWVLVTPSESLDAITDRLTIAAWVNLEGMIMNWGTAASRQIGSSNDQHYHLSLNAEGKPSMFVVTASAPSFTMAPDAVVPRTWVHLAGTYDGATARLYVNGAQVDSKPVTGSFAPDSTPLILGGNGNDATGVPTELFPGRVDEIMLYRRALRADEIERLHAGALLLSVTASGDAGALNAGSAD